MELESDLAKELFDKVILPIQAKNIDSKKTYQNIPVKQDNTEQEKTHREALLRLNEKHKREIKEKQKEMEKTQELEDLNKITQSEPLLPAPPAIKVNKEELLSENNIDNLLTILRKTLSQKQDELYAGLLEAIGEISEEQESWLWDYCYNCNGDSDYSEYVRNKIYGDKK